MNTLIIKLNASGDVVRTTTLLRALEGDITWVTAPANTEFLAYETSPIRCFEWADRERAMDRHYDLVINLEDELQQAQFAGQLRHTRVFGAYLSDTGAISYTEDSRAWFDLSLISVYGRQQADALKLQNRRTYQDLIFDGLGLTFTGQRYVLPRPKPTTLEGDVAIAPVAGAVWPMKSWAYYDQLKAALESAGLIVNVLPTRPTLLQHMADVSNHRCLVGGDSLPMHFALGTGTPCVTLFNCTSPWEIYDYGLQTQLISPLLERFFYKRNFDVAATTAIRLEDVFDAVMERVKSSPRSREARETRS